MRIKRVAVHKLERRRLWWVCPHDPHDPQTPRPHAPARMLVGNVGYLFSIAHIAHTLAPDCVGIAHIAHRARLVLCYNVTPGSRGSSADGRLLRAWGGRAERWPVIVIVVLQEIFFIF